jgi:hypothetical protein
MTAGLGLPVCQATPRRTHGQFFSVISKSTVILRLNDSRDQEARLIATHLLLDVHRIREENSKIKI